ncbi:CLAVATA3/ESR-RELATED 44 [Perilla frutescens var. hirtella]|uniref:CLAVATA3/ESR-RELATED 44 n=1 Tax=Perilla frutescens var. hirtella TaxID=608512 RepID=A0AAD4JGJ3_PERFH|nr:CLAVATA3/ESR-RELATED 44 [Perilla frutescens var. hirtella]KAH6816179.1 CLAVATA3/ESR-RELATED 44 [Perilla frutescens var. frutescens]KAH6832680.1 CLAVATA3/ESR-RELATED 44 [Perilla frutescens var. hirtella]
MRQLLHQSNQTTDLNFNPPTTTRSSHHHHHASSAARNTTSDRQFRAAAHEVPSGPNPESN